MRNQLYIGWCLWENRYKLFRSETTPNHETHGAKYSHSTGPFRTLAGAHFMIDHGRNNPHCQTVSDAERLAKAGY